MNILIFGYGSLMNEDSHTQTVGCDHIDRGFTNLSGYERIFNLNFKEWVFLNIRPHATKKVYGNVIEITRDSLEQLIDREVGYDLVEITNSLDIDFGGPVYTFIAPEQEPQGSVKQSYINKSMFPLKKEQRKKWLEDSILKSPIYPDEDPIEM